MTVPGRFGTALTSCLRSGDVETSYEELEVLSSSVTRVLLRHQAEKGLICLYAERSLPMVVMILGIAGTGSGYVPIDIAAPESRVQYVLQDCGNPLVLTVNIHRLLFTGRPCLLYENIVDENSSPRLEEPMPSVSSSDVLYAMYTSGTTGHPKAVMVEHWGLVNRVDFLQATFPMRPGQGTLQKAFYGFGVSEWEIFWPLLTGRMLRLADPHPAAVKDAEYLLFYKDVTHFFCVPSQLDALIDFGFRNTTIQYVFSAGEALQMKQCRDCKQILPNATVVNLYGPTEADMTYFVFNSLIDQTSLVVPAGFPILNSRVFLNEEGEICFAGRGVSRGYLNRPELTAELFSVAKSGERIYRTGDRGRFDDQGCLHFLGRADRQVKVRGVRIELGQIEAGLRAAGAQRAVADVFGSSSSASLVAWVTPQDAAASIKKNAARILPANEVPSRVIGVDKMPLTSNGKVDRKLLKAQHQPRAELSRRNGASTAQFDKSTLEGIIMQAWVDVLGRGLDAGSTIDSTFESLGATSLLVGRAVSLLRKNDIVVSMTDLFVYDTARKLAERVRSLNHRVVDERSRSKSSSRWHGRSSTRPFALACNAATFVLTSFVDFDAGLPAAFEFGVAVFLYSRYSFLAAWISATILNFVLVFATTLFAAWLKKLLRVAPGDYPIFGSHYLRWHTATSCYQHVYAANRDLFADTPVMSAFFRFFGARIQANCELDCFLHDPEVVSIGAGTKISRDAVVSGHALTRDGLLRLVPVSIGDYSLVHQRAFVVAGTKLNSESEVGAMATTDGLDRIGRPPAGSVGLTPRRRKVLGWSQRASRCVFGIPSVGLIRQLPNGLALVLLSQVLYGGKSPADDNDWWSLRSASVRDVVAFCWLYSLLTSQIFFWLVVVLKHTFLSARRCGQRGLSRWILSRLVGSEQFEQAVGPWINTEVLSWLYRCLGARIGKRVQMDAFYALDHELVSVGDNVVFGHGVSLETSAEVEEDEDDEKAGLLKSNAKRPSTMRQTLEIASDAEVLDHCHLELGSRVDKSALLGSTTLVPRNYVVEEGSTSMGNVDQAPVVLRTQRSAARKKTELEAIARLRHESTLAWTAFNCWNAIASLVLEPLVIAVWVVSATLASKAAGDDIGRALLVFPFVEFLVMVLHCCLVCSIKWILIGTYRSGDHAFYGPYHYKWVVALLLTRSLKPLLDTKLRGTPLMSLVYRAFGAKVGNNCCIMSSSVEYDLIEFGDHCAVGFHVTLQPHTVEHMVIKLGKFRVTGKNTALRHLSAVMPDTEIEGGGQLLENSLLPKGCVVADGSTWAGLPAKEVVFDRLPSTPYSPSSRRGVGDEVVVV